MENPFNPQFGALPNIFIGRKQIIENITFGTQHANSPFRTTIISGIRGSGKTALLSDIKQILSQDKKVIVVDVTAHEQMLDEILQLIDIQTQTTLGKSLSSLTGIEINLFGSGVSLSKENPKLSFRVQLDLVLQKLTESGITVVIQIDEVHNNVPQIRELAIAYQHFVRDNRKIALVMAGLPSSVSDVLNDDVLTFLRRSNLIYLTNLDLESATTAFIDVFSEANKVYNEQALRLAVKLTEGYAYFYQLVGYYLFEVTKNIDENLVQETVAMAKQQLYRSVHDLIWKELSDLDKEFLHAMSEDDGDSKTGDIAERLNRNTSTISTYRQRLIDAGVIARSRYGYVKFTLPYMKDYIIEHMSF
jgi:AAA+ ATPase superfamily predicted ATPase